MASSHCALVIVELVTANNKLCYRSSNAFTAPQ